MTTQLSTRVRNAMANAIESTIGTGPRLRILSGTPPANPATAQSGTLLAEMTLPTDWLTAASAGLISLIGTWQDAAADASGYATYFRILDSSLANVDWQGLCSQAWAASTAYVVGQQVNNGGLVYRCTTAGTSASSGGPTGTGSGITDGTAVWTYVGTVDMVLDNTNIAAGQQVNVSSFSYTRGNA